MFSSSSSRPEAQVRSHHDWAVIKNYDAIQFSTWLKLVTASPATFLKNAPSDWLTECQCEGEARQGPGPHNRANPLQLRQALEERILASVDTRDPSSEDTSIALLSIGSGGLFQELVILAKLYQAGHKKITLHSIDDDSDSFDMQENQMRRELFIEIIKKWNEVLGTNIKFTHVSHIQDLIKVEYDVVYAVDIDDAQQALTKDYSGFNPKSRDVPSIEQRTGLSSDVINSMPQDFIKTIRAGISKDFNFGVVGDDSYQLTNLLFIAATRLVKRPSALFWLSTGTQVYAFNARENYLSERRYLDFTRGMDITAYHDSYYIVDNISALLLNFHVFLEKRKPVFINNTICNEETRLLIAELIVRGEHFTGYKLDIHFISHYAAVMGHLAQGTPLVIAHASFDENNNENARYILTNQPRMVNPDPRFKLSHTVHITGISVTKDMSVLNSTNDSVYIRAYPSYSVLISQLFIDTFAKQDPAYQQKMIMAYADQQDEALQKYLPRLLVNLPITTFSVELRQEIVDFLNSWILTHILPKAVLDPSIDENLRYVLRSLQEQLASKAAITQSHTASSTLSVNMNTPSCSSSCHEGTSDSLVLSSNTMAFHSPPRSNTPKDGDELINAGSLVCKYYDFGPNGEKIEVSQAEFERINDCCLQ